MFVGVPDTNYLIPGIHVMDGKTVIIFEDNVILTSYFPINASVNAYPVIFSKGVKDVLPLKFL